MAQDFAALLTILGGEATLGTRAIHSERDLDTLIHEGLPVAALDHTILVLGATRRAILDGVGIARSTVRRRKGVEGKRLDLVESERTVRLAVSPRLGTKLLARQRRSGVGCSCPIARWAASNRSPCCRRMLVLAR